MRRIGLVVVTISFLILGGETASLHAGLIQSFQMTGNLGLEVSAVSNLAGQLPSMAGMFTISTLPPGAAIQKAFVYSNDWGSSVVLPLDFNGTLLFAQPFQSDQSTPINQLFAYRWDVTPFIAMAPASYTFKIAQTIGQNRGNQIAGAALAVVWQFPLTPRATVSIIDGAQQVGEGGPETETASFANLPQGPTALNTFTVSDDKANSGEVVKYNGIAVGGPIDENLGLGASLLQLSGTSVAGANTVSITTGNDHFGWLLATSVVSLPQPPALLFAALGALALVGLRRRPRANHP